MFGAYISDPFIMFVLFLQGVYFKKIMIGKRKDSRASQSNVASKSLEGSYETNALIENNVWVLSLVGIPGNASSFYPLPFPGLGWAWNLLQFLPEVCESPE